MQNDRSTKILNTLALLLILGALGMALLYAPTERTMGDVQRIFYFHVSAAWVGFFAFFVTMVAGIGLLIWRQRRWDVVAACSAEIGLFFMTMAIVTGSLWARPTWNTWWTWDPRLTVSAVQWLLYVAYFMLRAGVADPTRTARFAAVYGIVAFVTVPLSFFAIRWWRTIHPVVIGSGEGGGMNMEPEMIQAMIFGVVAFTFLYLALMRYRVRLELVADRLARLRQRVLMR